MKISRLNRMKNIWKKVNPINRLRIKRLRSKLINRKFTLITSNCIGGIIYHDLGLRFLSPTINTRISSKEFVKFVINLDNYLKMPLCFIPSDESYPVAILGDVTINFVHYHSEEEAMQKWEERKLRINWDNIFIITNDCDGITEDDIKKLDSLPYHVAVFTARDYPNIKSAIYMSCFKNRKYVGNTLKQNPITGKRVYEKYIDLPKWFNCRIKNSFLF